MKLFDGVVGDGDMIPNPMDPQAYADFAGKQVWCIDEKSGAIEPIRVSEKTSKDEYYKFVEKTFADMLALIKRKNADYSGTADDPFANFRRANAVGVDPIQGIAVRFLDKVARIESFFQSGKLENESFEDARLDVIGYACLALGMLNEKRGK